MCDYVCSGVAVVSLLLVFDSFWIVLLWLFNGWLVGGLLVCVVCVLVECLPVCEFVYVFVRV